ncbi:MAG TPA: PVC-type heme-binding CxxCH protein [Tepidisphaeraceae bacterium]|nr:PVC-type heme-binding CxxCH protein [Tepidisphaeraceae bacterium]
MTDFNISARRVLFTLLLLGLVGRTFLSATTAIAAQTSVTYPPKDGPGKGKHIVFLSGDEEYRSEEGLPMLAKILSQRHGFKCTVLFALDPDGAINPDNQKSLPDAEALDSADAIVMLLRFRNWPDDAMKHFVDAYKRGVPILGLRTATHSFQIKEGAYKDYSNFGKRVLGEQWVSHWGNHKKEATKGIIEPSSKDDPILRGVTDVFGDSDVYEAYPPADAKILLRGQVLKGMKPTDPPASYPKKRATDKQEQDVNTPMMAVAWTRLYKNEAGNENKIFCTTLGAATDLQNESLRRLIVNAAYWGLGIEVPQKADVTYVGDYKPTPYGFKGYRKGIKVEEHNLTTTLGAANRTGAPVGAASAAVPSTFRRETSNLPSTSSITTSSTAANISKALQTENQKTSLLTSGGPLELKKDDHIALIGNTLPDRMQHSGYLETLIYARNPRLNLIFRNLSAAGDEVAFRHRSENFGAPDEWLKKVKADVIFAFFGFNESFKGKEGLDQFKSDLDKYLKETQKKDFSGKGPPRIVLFSPIANERNQDKNFFDPAQNNANLDLYTKAMAEVAKSNHVQFVDLFIPSQLLYTKASQQNQSLTVNGLHLTDTGDKLLAPEIFRGLFDETPPEGNFEKLRQAVNDKNWLWHTRYRTMDGYNVYGGRSRLAFPSKDGQKISNYDVMQEEMSQRDVMTANRDLRVLAVAQGGDFKVDDSNLPPVTKFPTNKPGPLPDGKYPFLGGEEAIAKMKPHANTKVNLFASEENWPELINPVQMAWDTKGRLWVAVWPSYPERTPTSRSGDSLLIFEDTDGDGKADKCTHFLDDLNCPTGFQFYKDGVLLMQAPDLWFVRDTNGDGVADTKERILMGMDSADSHHTTNSMCLDPGGAVYLSDGVFHRTQVETADGPVRNNDAAIYRFEPRTGKFETYISYGFANPHGRVFDYWGNDIVTDATGNASYFGPAFSGQIDYPQKHKRLNEFWARPSRPCPGTAILTSRHFPDDWQGNFLNINVISFQGIYRVNVRHEGSGLAGTSLPDLLSSTDPNFRPTGAAVGPDGALYIIDWHQPLIGHMQHHIRDPNRDHDHGRIYRMTYEGRPLMPRPKIDGQPVAALLDFLKEPENQIREWAKVELGKHDSNEVIAAVNKWAEALDKNDPAYEHHLTEALWMHQWHNVVNENLLKRMLRSPQPNARAAATRVLCYWRDRIADPISLLKTQASDESPRVRLEAVRAASFFRDGKAVEIVLAAQAQPTDYYLDYTIGETMRQLDPYWRKAIASGQTAAPNNPAGLKFLRTLSAPDLLKLPKSEPVLQAIVLRMDINEAFRGEALNTLATQRKTTRAAVALSMMDTIGKDDPAAANTLARLLPLQPPEDLKPIREKIKSLTKSSASEIRQAAWGALALSDGSFDAVWKEASQSASSLTDLLAGIPLIFDPEVRNQAYDKVKPLVASDLPAELTATIKTTGGARGRFVRIDLPRRGTLTLAEVQVFSEGKNIAPAGKATQSSTSNGGDASKAIDGNTNGLFGAGSQTHTVENENRPWWEVDLGGEFPIEAVTIWNRTESAGAYVRRLENFNLTILDSAHRELFKKPRNPAPPESVRINIPGGGDGPGAIRRAAINALVSMPANQPATFAALANLIQKPAPASSADLVAAARGIRNLPRKSWTTDPGANVPKSLVAWAKKIPPAERTTQEYLTTIQLAGDMLALLPPADAAALRKDLKEIRVAVFVITTVREQMRYDTPRLVVEAGKPFEIIVENADFMPHNLVVVNPGTRKSVADASAEMMPDQLDKQGRSYIPKSSDVLGATKLLENGQQETLKLTAPTKEGEYEYVCTFPGHWEFMWGRLIVTKDPDAYLQSNPDPAPAGPGGKHTDHAH